MYSIVLNKTKYLCHPGITPKRMHGKYCGNTMNGLQAFHGDKIVTYEKVIRQLQKLAGLDTDRKLSFPGASPVSLERQNFKNLWNVPYWVCEKSDGIRALLMCCRIEGKNVAVLFDRAMNPYHISMKALPRAAYQGTLLDGELMIGRQGLTCPFSFLIFDAIIISGIPTGYLPLPKRIANVHQCLSVYTPHYKDTIRVFVKRFALLSNPEECRVLIANMSTQYPIDGIVFTSENEPVTYGRCYSIYKLKTHHTVDFVLEEHGALSVYDPMLRKQVPVARLSDHARLVDVPKGSVVECEHVTDELWSFLLCRKDKNTSNDILTYQKTMVNIQERVTFEEVLSLSLSHSTKARVSQTTETSSEFVHAI